MRERMSRPSWSVPSQCAQEGVGWARAARLVAFGGYGAITGASTAAAIQNTMMPAPTSAGLDSRSRPSRRVHVRRTPERISSGVVETRSAVAGTAMVARSGPDARVEHDVRQVAENLRQHSDADRDERAHL